MESYNPAWEKTPMYRNVVRKCSLLVAGRLSLAKRKQYILEVIERYIFFLITGGHVALVGDKRLE